MKDIINELASEQLEHLRKCEERYYEKLEKEIEELECENNYIKVNLMEYVNSLIKAENYNLENMKYPVSVDCYHYQTIIKKIPKELKYCLKIDTINNIISNTKTAYEHEKESEKEND